MNGAKNCLAVFGKGINQVEDGPRSLTVKTRCGLVQEQKKLRFRCEFNSDSETFTLFNVETYLMSIFLPEIE